LAAGEKNTVAPLCRAPIIFWVIPPIAPTLPVASIVPVPAMYRPPVSDPGVSLSMIPNANIIPALGPPTSRSPKVTLKG
jgi:hypothetical protein